MLVPLTLREPLRGRLPLSGLLCPGAMLSSHTVSSAHPPDTSSTSGSVKWQESGNADPDVLGVGVARPQSCVASVLPGSLLSGLLGGREG